MAPKRSVNIPTVVFFFTFRRVFKMSDRRSAWAFLEKMYGLLENYVQRGKTIIEHTYFSASCLLHVPVSVHIGRHLITRNFLEKGTLVIK